MGISIFFSSLLVYLLSEKQKRPIYLPIGAQKQKKTDFPSFGGPFKSGCISTILNFYTLIFWKITSPGVLSYTKKSRKFISQTLTS